MTNKIVKLVSFVGNNQKILNRDVSKDQEYNIVEVVQ